MNFQAVAWKGEDQDDQYTIRIFGRAEDGRSVSLGTKFNPYCYIKTDATRDAVKGLFWRGLVSCQVQNAKDLWGFRNGELSRFLKLEFKSHRALRNCAYCVDNNKFPELHGARMYESNMDPVLRFMHCSGITSTGWVDPGICEPDLESTCEVNLWAPDWRHIKPVARDDLAPLRIMSFDIECYSSTGGFPDPKLKADAVFQIAMTTKEFGKEGYLDRKCLCLKETEGYEWFATEKELLQAFEKHLIKVDPDIITGWNIFGFDLEYLIVRATIHCGLEPHWGRIKGEVSELVEKNLSSSALGNNQLKMVPMTGRYVFDLFQDVKREHKLESYSLNNVSKHFLKDQKLDMPPKEMFARFREGNPAKLGEVADYCIKDTELPHALMEKLCQIQNQVEMAKACWVPLAFLSERGQQIKVFSQMAKKARELNFVIPTFKRSSGGTDPEDGYQGATVLEAQTGAYYSPITALDFASLYPSIMCAENLCYSTLVMDSKYDNLPGVTYETFGPHRFAQAPAPSLLPVILMDLKAFRKKAKKDMAATEGTPMEAIYNGKQLAYKISMNSIYGFTGASKGMLPLVAIASTVTMRGRQMIEETKNYVEEHFPGAKVRYGDTDSVMVEFDVQGRKGQEAIDYSWELGEQASEQCSKLFKAPNDLELEKIYCPYFLYSKKRYAAKMWEGRRSASGALEVKFKKIDVKGLQVVRRDSCPFVRETLKKLLGMVLESSDPRPVIQAARDAARDLMNGKVPMEKLMLSKQLAADYKVVQPHVEVRNKMRARAPGSEPQQGDRVPFVIVRGPGKMYEKAEDPGWVVEKGISLDYDYYFSNQFKKPVQDLLEPLVSADEIFDKKFMVKTTSTSEIEARKAFLTRFGLKVSNV